jgi:hypothetical protein
MSPSSIALGGHVVTDGSGMTQQRLRGNTQQYKIFVWRRVFYQTPTVITIHHEILLKFEFIITPRRSAIIRAVRQYKETVGTPEEISSPSEAGFDRVSGNLLDVSIGNLVLGISPT